MSDLYTWYKLEMLRWQVSRLSEVHWGNAGWREAARGRIELLANIEKEVRVNTREDVTKG